MEISSTPPVPFLSGCLTCSPINKECGTFTQVGRRVQNVITCRVVWRQIVMFQIRGTVP